MYSIVNYFYSQQITCGIVLTDAIEYLNILPPKFHSERPSASDSPWQNCIVRITHVSCLIGVQMSITFFFLLS